MLRAHSSKKHRCSRCNRLRRGHEGPCGLRCEMPLPDVSRDIWEEEESDGASLVQDTPKSRGNRSHSRQSANIPWNDPFVAELTRQLGELSSNVSTLMASRGASDVAPSRSSSEKVSTPITPLPSTTVDAAVSLTNGARVTKKVIAAAKAGEYTNLIDFIPASEPTNIMEGVLDQATGHLICKQKTVKKNIDNYLTWALAWSGYEELLLEDKACSRDLYRKCVSYRLFILKQNALYAWSAVEQYDTRFRHSLSLTHSFEFHKVDTDLGFSIFNSMAIKPNQQGCFRCKSLLHHVKDCPFPETHSVEKAPGAFRKNNSRNSTYQNQNSRSGNSFARSREICYNYNSGRCTDSTVCGRLHICSGCGGPDPMPRCPKCSPPPSNYGHQQSQQGGMGPTFSLPSR